MTFNTHHIYAGCQWHMLHSMCQKSFSQAQTFVHTDTALLQTNKSLCTSVMFALSLHRSNTMNSKVSISETNCSS